MNEQCADIDEMDRRNQSKAMFAAVKRMTGQKRERRLNGRQMTWRLIGDGRNI